MAGTVGGPCEEKIMAGTIGGPCEEPMKRGELCGKLRSALRDGRRSWRVEAPSTFVEAQPPVSRVSWPPPA